MTNEQNLVMEAYDDLYASDKQYGKGKTCHKLIFSSVASRHLRKSHNVLDIGCGRGPVIKELVCRGFTADGVEPCKRLLENDLVGLNVFPLFISEMKEIGDASYDIVTCVNVVDHLLSKEEVPNALAELSRISNMLVILCVNGDRRMQRVDQALNWWIDKIINHTDLLIEIVPDPWRTCDLMLLWKENENSALYTKKFGTKDAG
jgi:2-polyprenyl-3-methyl-5-hydroxy-6-metoxy-1,4-benzoquinol methylase